MQAFQFNATRKRNRVPIRRKFADLPIEDCFSDQKINVNIPRRGRPKRWAPAFPKTGIVEIHDNPLRITLLEFCEALISHHAKLRGGLCTGARLHDSAKHVEILIFHAARFRTRNSFGIKLHRLRENLRGVRCRVFRVAHGG